MKRTLITLMIFISSVRAFGQAADHQINHIVEDMQELQASPEEIKSVIKEVINDPDVYNSLWQKFIDQSFIKDSKKWAWIRDLNIQFKTFESENNAKTALGFTYDFNYDYAKYTETKKHNRVSHFLGASAKGNVAFKKQLNTANFLETKVNYDFSYFSGGVVENTDSEIFSHLNDIGLQLGNMEDPHSKAAMKLWDDFGKHVKLSNQYYISISPKFAFECNQDFTKRQFTPGSTLNLGAKAWHNNDALAMLNVFDYPFALLRLLLGTDKKFTVYGSTIPTAQLSLDMVIPSADTTREQLLSNTNPYPRMKFETSFRTFIKRIGSENIFFNANLRYYRELNAPVVIQSKGLDENLYFVMALQSTSGFYVSYATGRLPFDARNDQVYSLGFNYNFNKK